MLYFTKIKRPCYYAEPPSPVVPNNKNFKTVDEI